MRKVIFIEPETEETVVHYDSPFSNDAALCGYGYDEVKTEVVSTNKRVSCEQCRMIVDYVRGN